MPTGTTKIILTGENAKALKAINDVGSAAEKNAAKASSAFDKSTTKVGGSFSKLSGQLGQFGVPFAGALSVMGSKLESSGGKAETFGKKLVHVGDVAAATAAVGIAAVGASAIHAALEGEAAHARLTTAVVNTGHSYDDYGGRVDALNSKMAKLGFENDDVESSLATLTGATHDTGKAIELMGLASDIARGRHISLEEATAILVKVETGRVGSLGRLGISTKDVTGKTISQEEAIKRLTELYGGQAGAFTDTYAGKVAAMQATVKNLEEEMGQKLIPVVEGVVDSFLTGIDTFSRVNAATDGVAGKMAVLSGGALAAAYAGAKVVTAFSSTVELFGTVAAKIGLKTAAEVADATATTAAATANAANTTAIAAEGAAAATTAGELGALGAAGEASGAGLAAGGAGLGVIGSTGLVAAAGIAALGESYGNAKLQQRAQDSGFLAEGMLALADSASSVVPGVKVVTSALSFMGVGQEHAKKTTDELAKSTDELKSAEADYKGLLKSGTASSDELAAAKHRVAEAAGHVSTEQGKQKAIQDSLTAAEQEGTGATDTNTAAQKAAADAATARADAAKKVEDALAKLGDVAGKSAVQIVSASHLSAEAIDGITTAAQGMNDAAAKAFGPGAGAGGVIEHFKDQTNVNFKDVQKFMLENLGKTQHWATELARLADLGLNQGFLKELADAGPASEPLVKSILDNVKTGGIQSLNALADGADKMTKNLDSHLDNSVVYSATAVARWNANLDKTRKEIKTRLIIEERGYSDAITKLRTITNLASYGQTAIVTFTGGGTGAGGQYRAKAAGGPVSAGSPYVVGEKGPELFVPKTSGMIVPNGALSTGRSVSSGATNFYISVSGLGEREIANKVVGALREWNRTKGPIKVKVAG